MEGRPARIEPVFIWHTDPTWFNPSAQQPLKTDILSTCLAISGYQSETQLPLCPCCLKVRSDGMMALLPVPIAVVTLPNDAGIGLPASASSAGFGSNVSTWLGPPSMNSQMTDFAVGAKCGGLARKGSSVFPATALCNSPSLSSIAPRARAPSPLPALNRKSRRDLASRL